MPTLRLDADAKAGVKALGDLDKAVDNIKKGLDDTAISARKLENAASRIVRENETPLERYNRKIKETSVLLEKEKITREQAERAVTKYRKELESAGRSQKALSDETDKAALSMKKQGAALKQSLETPLEKHKRQLLEVGKLYRSGAIDQETFVRASRKLKGELNATTGAMKEQDKAAEGAFDTSRVLSFAASFSGPTAAARLLLGLLQNIRTEQQALAQSQLTEAESRGQLVQLAGGDRAKRDRLFAVADKTFNEGFVSDRTQANRLAFELESAGLTKDRQFYSQLQLIDDSAVLAKSTGLIQSGFSGGDATGGSRAIVSKAIAGALPATGVSPAQIAEGVAAASAAAKGFGLSDEETFAAVSRIAQTTGSGSEAGTRFNRMLSALSRQGLADQLQGQGIEAVVSHVSGLGLSQEELTKFLGSSEAKQALDVLSDTGALRGRIAEIRNAQSGDLAGQTIANAIEDPTLASAVLRRRGAAVRVLAQGDAAVAENLAQADRDAAFAQEVMAGNTGRAALNDWSRRQLDYWLGPGGGEQAMQELIEETRRQTDAIQQSNGTRQEN